jgi:tight adherence protein C
MPLDLFLAVSGVFVLVALAAGGATWHSLGRLTPEHRRRAAVLRPTEQRFVLDAPMLAHGPDPRLARLTRLIPKSPKNMSRVQRQLTRAGYEQPEAVLYFCLAEMILPVVFGGAVLLSLGFSAGLLPAVFVGVLGYLLPVLFVGRKKKQRQKAIKNGLPDALDLLTVCVEAGSGLDQAIAKTSDELFLTHPALASELRMITTETRAGKPRLEAFRNFAQRTAVDDVRTLVSLLAQTDRFGTSIAQALRTHSESSRTKRRQAAEESAGKIGVKLVFPLALCLFPALYIVCIGPVIVRIYRAFAQ